MTGPTELKTCLLPHQNRNQMLDCMVLVLAAVLVYGRLVGADFQASWDDNIYILDNKMVHGFSWEYIRSAFGIGKNSIGQYNPLSLLSFMLDYTLWGLNPGGYHLTNIVLHVLNGLLVYRLISGLHGDRLVSLIAAAVFLLHPVQVESVAWISERKGLLSLFFLLVSWELYIRHCAPVAGKGRFAYAGSLISFVLALLAKTSSVVLPVLLILYDWCFVPRGKRMSIRDKVPFLAAAAVFSAIEIYSERPEKGGSLAGYHGGSPLTTFFTMLPVFCRYLRLLLWPSGLTVEHWPPIHSSLNLTVVGSAVVLSAIMIAGIILFRRDRKLGFWFLFFWVGLLPVSQIVPLFLLMYEHYLYMPIIGAAVLAGSGAAFLRDRMTLRRPAPLYSILGIWLLILSVVSFDRTYVWQDSMTLFLDSAVKSPDAFRVWEVLGGIHFKSGRFADSRMAYERALALKPDNTDALWTLGEIHALSGEMDRAEEYQQRLLKINPAYVKAWASLGTIYRDRGDYSTSEEMYKKALKLQPEAMQVVLLLGELAILQNKYDEARGYLKRVEENGGDTIESAYLMSCVESLSGNANAALAWLETALGRGFHDYSRISTDPGLTLLWKEPRFSYLLLKYFPDMETER